MSEDTVYIKSRIGYGCSSLMGRLTRQESLRLLDCAYDNGIRHFDTARSYGYGEAEGVLGEFLRGRRDTVSITTKVGFMPPSSGAVLGAARQATRKVADYVPALKKLLRRGATAMVRKAEFTPEFIRLSLATSLRELQTDYVDILLLHECDAQDLIRPGIVETLHALQKEGLIRAYGVGSNLAKSKVILDSLPSRMPVMQFENNPLVRSMESLALAGLKIIVTHRAIGEGFHRIVEALEADNKSMDEWSMRLNIAPRDFHTMAELFLRYSLSVNPHGGVLFSSTNSERIRDNASLADRPSLDEKSRTSLESLASSYLLGHEKSIR